MPDFDGGLIEIKFRSEQGRLSVDYATLGEDRFQSCISSKFYPSLRKNGYVGITAGNPYHQNVNDIDVYSVNFFNLNSKFYQHDAEEIVEVQQYYARDENGFVGNKKYPWSAKLNTLKLEKVAYDVFQIKRNQRDYYKEQFTKSLHIIKREDDISEMLYKMFEQVRLLNEDLKAHSDIQESKKSSIRNLERLLIHEDNYRHFLDQLKEQDAQLFDISTKFSELTKEAKRILDTIKEKSEARKQQHGVQEGEKISNHHRSLPKKVKDEVATTLNDVSPILLILVG